MTMKPKARKFRIRRTTNDSAESASGAGDVTPPIEQKDMAAPNVEQTPPNPPEETHAADSGDQLPIGSQNIGDIRKEGLTGRQLRMARRMAQKHGLAPTSDFDAVRLLRARGVDPFQPSNIVKLVESGVTATGASQAETAAQLPQTRPIEKTTLPATDMSPAERRAREIQSIQNDIASRRRRKLGLLLTRLAAFVMLPTLITGYYFYVVATPMYTTKSEFLILTADGSGGGGGALGGLLPSQFATGQDSIATQSYLASKDAMLRLDRDLGFHAHFSQDSIDPLQQLDPEASNESVYKVYRKYVKLGYDPTEGVIRMELSTADPEVSKQFSERLIAYAEERVDRLSQEKRLDAVKTAEESLQEAKEERRAAQRRLVELQESSILDPEGEIAGIRSLINNVEIQLQEKQLALNTQLNNSRPNQARVEALRSELSVLQAELDKQNNRLNRATATSTSLASQAAEIQLAQADLATFDLVLQSALETKRLSEIEANKQVRFLTVAVEPVASQDPSYPRAFENTLVAFLIFTGIYLMISLTASVLREQVSS